MSNIFLNLYIKYRRCSKADIRYACLVMSELIITKWYSTLTVIYKNFIFVEIISNIRIILRLLHFLTQFQGLLNIYLNTVLKPK